MPRISATDVNKLLAKGMAALKPCPCCGSQASIETYDYLTVTLSCNNHDCKLKVIRYVLLPGHTIRWCIESAMKAWNKRPEEPKIAGQLRSLRDAARTLLESCPKTTPAGDWSRLNMAVLDSEKVLPPIGLCTALPRSLGNEQHKSQRKA